jgi:hypothetical protein
LTADLADFSDGKRGEEDLEKIEALFPEDQMMQAGLERYGAEWAGEVPLLAPVLREKLFHFWWD